MESIICRVTTRMPRGTSAAISRQTMLDNTTSGAAAQTMRNKEGRFLSALILVSQSFSQSGCEANCACALFLFMKFDLSNLQPSLESADLELCRRLGRRTGSQTSICTHMSILHGKRNIARNRLTGIRSHLPGIHYAFFSPSEKDLPVTYKS